MNANPAAEIPLVYLVDDEEVVREALAWLLRSRRLLSEGFASAEAFEAHLASQVTGALPWPRAPVCLLLDVRMPGTSGLVLFERLADRARLQAELSEREREVMRLIVAGRPNKLIADALGISVRTVEVHRARVFDKMGVRSAVELANLLRAGTADDDSPGGTGAA